MADIKCLNSFFKKLWDLQTNLSLVVFEVADYKFRNRMQNSKCSMQNGLQFHQKLCDFHKYLS